VRWEQLAEAWDLPAWVVLAAACFIFGFGVVLGEIDGWHRGWREGLESAKKRQVLEKRIAFLKSQSMQNRRPRA